jgi:hypothetical protein
MHCDNRETFKEANEFMTSCQRAGAHVHPYDENVNSKQLMENGTVK